MASSSLLADLAQAWTVYRESPTFVSFQQFELGERIGQVIDALWQMETATASAKEYISDDLDSAGLQDAINDLAPLLIVGPNSLPYELRQTWNIHLSGGGSMPILDALIQQTIKALAHADYFLDEAEGFVASNPGQDAHFETDLQELYNLIFPAAEPLSLV